MNAAGPLTPFVWYTLFVLFLTAAAFVLAHVLGERHRGRATDEPYESGMVPTGSSRVRFPSEFYLIAMFFVVFDLETVFIMSWAVAARALGWAGYAEIALFIGVLLVSLVYLIRIGALDWRTERQKRDLGVWRRRR